ncbi:exported hypothetical protein [Desulfamplus magnetovallimortis]|uniref:Lipoprotein n=1 Tax=Desulfamplus magnetovallimortis TaxID=1246637 RepID=A0A1W1HH20_9BACT|nr:hypothetical protein [Desulfamplus magnetovallimortis]SLM31769.1 exported hypothetical protein [Desulfamplus magnetovallimortis]
MRFLIIAATAIMFLLLACSDEGKISSGKHIDATHTQTANNHSGKEHTIDNTVTPNQKTSAEKQNTSVEKQNTSVEKQSTSVEKQSTSVEKQNTSVEKQDSYKGRNMANPAAKKCVEDGYELKPIIKNGVTVGHMCIDPETNRSCEVWSYFRKECFIEP